MKYNQMFLSDSEFEEIAKQVSLGNAIAGNQMDLFLRDLETKNTLKIVNKYNLNEKQLNDFDNAILQYDYLSNEGVYFKSFDCCFVDEEYNKIEVDDKTMCAYAEYVIMCHKIYVELWEDNAVKVAEEILKRGVEVKNEL